MNSCNPLIMAGYTRKTAALVIITGQLSRYLQHKGTSAFGLITSPQTYPAWSIQFLYQNNKLRKLWTNIWAHFCFTPGRHTFAQTPTFGVLLTYSQRVQFWRNSSIRGKIMRPLQIWRKKEKYNFLPSTPVLYSTKILKKNYL